MSWQLLVGFSVLLFSFNGLFHRVLMKDKQSDPYAQTVAFYGLGGLLALMIAFFQGGFHYQIALNQLLLFVVLTIFATAAPVLGFKALKIIEASENTILLSSQRIWIVVGAFIFLHEAFSVQKLLGTVIILVGISVATWQRQRLILNKGVLYAISAAFCYAAAELVAFNILRNFDVPSFTVYVCFLPVITLLLFKPKTIKRLTFYLRPRRLVNIILVSINDTVATLLLFFAYQVGRNAAQIAPLMATQTLLAVLLAVVILKEHTHLVRKVVAALVVVGGVGLVL